MLGVNNNYQPAAPSAINGSVLQFAKPSGLTLTNSKVQFWLLRDGAKMIETINYNAPTVVGSTISITLTEAPQGGEVFELNFFDVQ